MERRIDASVPVPATRVNLLCGVHFSDNPRRPAICAL